MKLERLPGGDPQRVVPVFGGEPVQIQVLRGGQHAARHPDPDHHDELFARLAEIPVILLVDAVELQKLVVVIRKSVCLGIGKGLGDRPGKGRASLLEEFIRRGCRCLLIAHVQKNEMPVSGNSKSTTNIYFPPASRAESALRRWE